MEIVLLLLVILMLYQVQENMRVIVNNQKELAKGIEELGQKIGGQ